MAVTSVQSSNLVVQWNTKFWQEFVRDNPFAKLMGETTDAPIQMIYDLEKKPGAQVVQSLVTRIASTQTALGGARGDQVLRGNEFALGNYGYTLVLDQYRNAVTIGKMEQKKVHIDMLNAAKPQLKNWLMELVRQQCITVLQTPCIDGVTPQASTTPAQNNTWVVAQNTASRVLFGHLLSQYNAVYATALQNVTSSNDQYSPSGVALTKRMVEGADPHLRPIRIDGGGEWYISLAHRYPFRDFKFNSTNVSVLEYAGVRGDENPLFNDGDLMYDGIVIKKVPEIIVLTGAGASGIDVGPVFTIGAQALGFAIGETAHDIMTKDEYDYGNSPGVGVAQIHCIAKATFPIGTSSGVQFGVHTGYWSGVADS